MKRLPHPAYSPDIAPSDFFLFGYVKEQQKGMQFEDSAALLSNIQEIFENMENGVLIRVFEEWITRLMWVIDHNGEYYHT
jgi:hypothetical protein